MSKSLSFFLVASALATIAFQSVLFDWTIINRPPMPMSLVFNFCWSICLLGVFYFAFGTIWLTVLAVVVKLGMYASLCYHSYTNHVIGPVALWELAGDSLPVLNPFDISLPEYWFIVILDIPFVGLLSLFFFMAKEKKHLLHGHRKSGLWMSAMGLVVCYLAAFFSGRLLNAADPDESITIARYGLVGFWVADIIAHFEPSRPVFLPSPRQIFPSYVADESVPRRIAVIQVESLDSNILSCSVDGRFVMPRLRALSENNFYVPMMHSQHLAGGSSDADFSVLNGLAPSQKYPSTKNANYDGRNGLPKLLSQIRFESIAVHNNYFAYFSRDVLYRKLGFNSLCDEKSMSLPAISWGASDESMYQWVKQHPPIQVSASQFLFCITMTSHTPFTFVDEIAPDIPQFHTGDQRTDNYLKSMSYVDRTLCDFVEDLISKKYLVIIYGDHAPAIPWTRTSMTDQVEKKLGYRDASIIDEKGRLHEFTPLIIANSGKAQFQTPASVSVLDLYPTILGLAGWNASASFVGVSLCGSPSTIISDIPFRGFDYSRIEIHSLAERASHLNVLHSLSK